MQTAYNAESKFPFKVSDQAKKMDQIHKILCLELQELAKLFMVILSFVSTELPLVIKAGCLYFAGKYSLVSRQGPKA